MPITFACPTCGYSFQVGDEHAGRTGSCPRCKGPIVAPHATAPTVKHAVATPKEAPVAPTVKRPSARQPVVPAAISGGEIWGECILCAERQRVSTGSLLTGRCAKCGGELVAAAAPAAGVAAGLMKPPVARPSNPRVTAASPPEVELARANPKHVFGPYVLLQELGRGGMGVVFKAWHEGLRHYVALKMLLTQDDADHEDIRRFYREAEAVARLRHPHIVAVHDVGEIEGKHYLAMDFIEGTTLEKKIKSEDRMTLETALGVMRDVALAVQHAHDQGVIHRDLKPQNILIDKQGSAFVLDFGLARIRDVKSKLTRSGTTLGTPTYMPPEQVGGSQNEVNAQSDVYSLGATLYFILTKRPPFEGASEVNVISAVLMKLPVPPSQLNPRARGDLETITLQCLEKDPTRRYASAKELAEDLDRSLTGEPILARPIGRIQRAWRWTRRNKAVAALVVVAGLLLASLSLLARGFSRHQADGTASSRPAPQHSAGNADAASTRDAQLQRLMNEMSMAAKRGDAGSLWAAVEVANKALAQFPQHRDSWQIYGLRSSTYYGLAIDLSKQHRDSEAQDLLLKSQEDVETALRSAPAKLDLEEQATIKALGVIRRDVKYFRSFNDPDMKESDAKIEEGDFYASIEACDRVIARDESSVNGYLHRGLSYGDLVTDAWHNQAPNEAEELLDKAKTDFEKVLALVPLNGGENGGPRAEDFAKLRAQVESLLQGIERQRSLFAGRNENSPLPALTSQLLPANEARIARVQQLLAEVNSRFRSKSNNTYEFDSGCLEACDKLIRFDPRCWTAYSIKGLCFQLQGTQHRLLNENAQARDSFRKAMATADLALSLIPVKNRKARESFQNNRDAALRELEALPKE